MRLSLAAVCGNVITHCCVRLSLTDVCGNVIAHYCVRLSLTVEQNVSPKYAFNSQLTVQANIPLTTLWLAQDLTYLTITFFENGNDIGKAWSFIRASSATLAFSRQRHNFCGKQQQYELKSRLRLCYDGVTAPVVAATNFTQLTLT